MQLSSMDACCHQWNVSLSICWYVWQLCSMDACCHQWNVSLSICWNGLAALLSRRLLCWFLTTYHTFIFPRLTFLCTYKVCKCFLAIVSLGRANPHVESVLSRLVSDHWWGSWWIPLWKSWRWLFGVQSLLLVHVQTCNHSVCKTVLERC